MNIFEGNLLRTHANVPHGTSYRSDRFSHFNRRRCPFAKLDFQSWKKLGPRKMKQKENIFARIALFCIYYELWMGRVSFRQSNWAKIWIANSFVTRTPGMPVFEVKKFASCLPFTLPYLRVRMRVARWSSFPIANETRALSKHFRVFCRPRVKILLDLAFALALSRGVGTV